MSKTGKQNQVDPTPVLIPNALPNKAREEKPLKGITKKSSKPVTANEPKSKNKQGTTDTGEPASKKAKPHRIVGTCELLTKIYNQNQIRTIVSKSSKLEDKQTFYSNNPIPPAPTRNAIAACMRIYSSRFLLTGKYPAIVSSKLKNINGKKSTEDETTDASTKNKKDDVTMSHDETTENGDNTRASLSISQPATIRVLHALDVALGNIFELIIHTHGEKNEVGVYQLNKKLTVSMITRAFMTLIHFNHIHPRIKGHSDLLTAACNSFISLYASKDLLIKSKGKDFFSQAKEDLITMFKESFKVDMASPLYRGEGVDGTFARYKVASAQKGCLCILELYSRLLISEVVHYSMELIGQKGMVTITDLVCDRSLSIIGFGSQ